MLLHRLLLLGRLLIERNPWYLAPFSWLYAVGVYLRNQMYNHRFLPITQVSCTVVSVGNIVAGGTGKTPFVHMLASSFPHRKVAILTRGYGVVPDEAILLSRRLPDVKVYIGKNRAALAKEASKHADLLIMDDGFQHRRLARDFDIVLTRAKKEHYLPWGFLRDSPKRLLEADEVFVADQDLKLVVKRILDLRGREIGSIQGCKVGIFCGIANPENFKKTVQELGAEIIAEKIFADHEPADLAKLPNVSLLICTEKDAVKIPPTNLPIYYLEMEMQFTGERCRWQKLIEKIDQKIDNRYAL
jgi:tetraacyldisaccharide 4'-kinase